MNSFHPTAVHCEWSWFDSRRVQIINLFQLVNIFIFFLIQPFSSYKFLYFYCSVITHNRNSYIKLGLPAVTIDNYNILIFINV